jgi:hypothetical protein
MEQLYGEENCTFNVHQLTHLVNSVKNFGPVSNVSAFIFKANNGNLKKIISGTRYIPSQIVSKFVRWRNLPVMAQKCQIKNARETVKNLNERLLTSKRKIRLSVHLHDGSVALGRPKTRNLGAGEALALDRLHGLVNVRIRSVDFYKKMLLDGVLYQTAAYCANYKRQFCCIIEEWNLWKNN